MHHGQMNPSSKEGELVYHILYPVTKALILWVLRTVVLGFTKVRLFVSPFHPSSTAKLSNLMADDTKSCPVGSRGVKKRWKMKRFDRWPRKWYPPTGTITYPPKMAFWVDDFPNFPRWDMLIPWRVCLGEVYKLYLYQSLPMVHGPIVKTSVCMNLLWLHHCL